MVRHCGRVDGDAAQGHGVSFYGDENFLERIVVVVSI